MTAEPEPRMDPRRERPEERGERGGHVDRTPPRWGEANALESREEPHETARGNLGDPSVVRDSAAEPPAADDAGRAAPDRDPAVVGRAQVEQQIAAVADPDVRRP